jgi:cell division GTPase FtsZ
MTKTILNLEEHYAAFVAIENDHYSNDDKIINIGASFIKDFKKIISILPKNAILSKNTVLVGFAIASGKTRAKKAIQLALSPFICKNKSSSAIKSISLLISSHKMETSLDEIGIINDYIQKKMNYTVEIIMSVNENYDLGDALAVTIITSVQGSIANKIF